MTTTAGIWALRKGTCSSLGSPRLAKATLWSRADAKKTFSPLKSTSCLGASLPVCVAGVTTVNVINADISNISLKSMKRAGHIFPIHCFSIPADSNRIGFSSFYILKDFFCGTRVRDLIWFSLSKSWDSWSWLYINFKYLLWWGEGHSRRRQL